MKKVPELSQALIERLRRLDSSAVANAVEKFDVRLRNVGFTDSAIRCLFPGLPPMVGYAATARVRTSSPPMEGHAYVNRTDWLERLIPAVPKPWVAVVEDLDDHPGLGSLVGEMYANILHALGCVGLVTNGAVRSLGAVRGIGLQMFAGNVCVSHAYAHIVDFGGPVTVGGMKVQPGDLLHGDVCGVQTIPAEIAPMIPEAADYIVQGKRSIVDLCRSGEFTIDKFRAATKDWKDWK